MATYVTIIPYYCIVIRMTNLKVYSDSVIKKYSADCNACDMRQNVVQKYNVLHVDADDYQSSFASQPRVLPVPVAEPESCKSCVQT